MQEKSIKVVTTENQLKKMLSEALNEALKPYVEALPDNIKKKIEEVKNKRG
jgi:hypothetical protein